jgi:hypothetical protein
MAEEGHPKTFDNWLAGYFTGSPRTMGFPSSEIEKINSEQRRIFEKKVGERYNKLRSDFLTKERESIDKLQFRQTELDEIEYILLTDQQPYKGDSETEMPIGRKRIKLGHLNSIRDSYQKAVHGELDLTSIASPNQQINIPSMVALEACMVEAVAFSKFMKFLKDPSTQNNGEEFTTEEQDDLRSKIEEVLAKISAMKDELQSGQEIIFDEISDLRNLDIKKKKTWREVVRGKIMEFAIKKAGDPKFWEWLHKELTDSEIKLLN